MQTFTVQCEYPALYCTTVTVEADDLTAACRSAIDAAGQIDAWKGVDHEQLTLDDIDRRGLPTARSQL